MTGIKDNFIGVSEKVEKLRRVLEIVSKRNINVLLLGETGAGKEIAARCLHVFGDRSDKPFVAINCTSIPETLAESELFGHEKGAFTDAKKAKQGLLSIANGGTVFLDEIGDMPYSLQVNVGMKV